MKPKTYPVIGGPMDGIRSPAIPSPEYIEYTTRTAGSRGDPIPVRIFIHRSIWENHGNR